MLNKSLIGVGLTLAGALALALGRLDAVRADRAQWRAEAQQSKAVIETLQAEVARTETILTELRMTRMEITADAARTRRALADLEASNEQVRAYLDQPVPDDLARLLWQQDDNRDDPADATGEPAG